MLQTMIRSILLYTIVFNIQAMRSRIIDPVHQQPVENTGWIARLKLIDDEYVFKFELLPIRTSNLNEHGLTDTLLTHAGFFGIRKRREGHQVVDHDQYAVVFVEQDSTGVETGRKEVVNISKILIHPKYEYNNSGYELAIIRLKRPVKIKPMVLSSFAIEDLAGCSLAGWVKELNFSVPSHLMITPDDYERHATIYPFTINLTELRAENQYSKILTAELPPLSPNETFSSLAGTPLICRKDDDLYLQGMIILKDPHSTDENIIYFVNLVPHYRWIHAAIDSSNTPVVFHDGLDKYERKISGVDSLLAGAVLKNKTYEDIWRNDSLSDKIIVKSNKITFFDNQHQAQIWHSTREDNTYDCAIVCYIENHGNPCSYSKESKECFFATGIFEPTAISSRVITIYFKTE